MGKVHINSKTLESYVSIILQENTNIVGKELFDSDWLPLSTTYSFSKWCVNTAQTIKVHKRDIFLLLNKKVSILLSNLLNWRDQSYFEFFPSFFEDLVTKFKKSYMSIIFLFLRAPCFFVFSFSRFFSFEVLILHVWLFWTFPNLPNTKNQGRAKTKCITETRHARCLDQWSLCFTNNRTSALFRRFAGLFMIDWWVFRGMGLK